MHDARLKPIFACLFLAFGYAATACTIFVTQGGGHVWVGNNEDDTPGQRTFLWFRPSPSLGYVLWGRHEATPEGGMNDHGLFFDAAALPQAIPIRKVPGRKDLEGYAVEPVLSHCRSVREALSYLGHYNLVWQEKAQIFLADRSGDCAIVHPNFVVRKGKGRDFVLTNRRLDTAKPEVCWRRGLALEMLASHRPHNLALVTGILKGAAQRDLSNATLYSDAVDLTTGVLTIYDAQRYHHPVTLNLKKELAKGWRVVDQASLFPISLNADLTAHGFDHALKLAEQGKTFDPDELPGTGYELLREGKGIEALKIFRAALKNHPSARAYSDLGNAFAYLSMEPNATESYRKALALDPSDYSANLMAGKDGWVTFRLKGFAHAKDVSVVGSFNGRYQKSLPLTRKNGQWFGQIRLRKGKYDYALHVDDTWCTDPDNGLAEKPGQYYSSVLIVR